MEELQELQLDRLLASLETALGRLEHHTHMYADREELVGTQTLINALRMLVMDAQREVAEVGRKCRRTLARMQTGHLSQERGSEIVRRALLKARNRSRSTLLVVGQAQHLISRMHGREFDPIASAYARLLRQLDDNTEMLFRPTEHLGYALGPPLLDGAVVGLRAAGSPLAARFERLPAIVWLQYPAASEKDVFEQLLIGHECAHLIMRRLAPETNVEEAEHRLERSIRELGPITGSAEEGFVDAGADQPPSDGASLPVDGGAAVHPDEPVSVDDEEDVAKPADPPSEETEDPVAAAATAQAEAARRRRRERSLSWFTELACDLLGVRLVGPAYALSLVEYAATRNWRYEIGDAFYETHPHFSWRLARLVKPVSRYLDALEEADETAAAIARKVFDRYLGVVPTLAWDRASEPELEAVERAVDGIDADSDVLLGRAAYDKATFARELPEVLAQLERRRAPSERLLWSAEQVEDWKDEPGKFVPAWSEPLDWRSILNGGYVEWLGRRPGEPVPEMVATWSAIEKQRRESADHLRGSIELAEFHRQAAAGIKRLGALDARWPK